MSPTSGVGWKADDFMHSLRISRGEAEQIVRHRAIDRLKHFIGAALQTARQEGLSEEDMEEAWRLLTVGEVHEKLLNRKSLLFRCKGDMHAKIECEGRDDEGTVTVSLKNGKVLKARFTDQEIFVLENSTGLCAATAEHVAGVAWAMSMDEGADACAWERLKSRASQSLKDFEAARLRVN